MDTAFLLDRRTFLGVAGVGVIAALAGCAPAAGTGASGGDGTGTHVLKWASSNAPWSWDPVVQGSGFQFNQLALVYASITEIDEDGTAQPGLAESWDYSEAGDAVTFHLRPGFTFTDGTALDAAAVKAYIERAKTQADSALDGDLTSIGEITADSPTDVTLHLTQVDHQIPLLLGRRVALVTSPASDPASLTSTPIGAGPFIATEIVPESHAVFERNPDYWNADAITIERIELSWGIDPSSIVSALQTGVYNFADIAAAQAVNAESSGIDVVVHPGFNAANISVNVNREPFTDPLVLDAVRHAIDRDELVDKITFGYGSSTAQPFPEGALAYSDEVADPWPYDVEKAKDLLAQAGHPDGIEIDFVVRDDVPANEIVQSQLAKAGITATLSIDSNWEEPFFSKELILSTYSTTGRESPVQTLTAHFGAQGPLNLSSPLEPQEFVDALRIARETPLDSDDYVSRLRAATAAGVRTSPTIFTYSQPNLFAKQGISDLPQVPGQIQWNGVTVG